MNLDVTTRAAGRSRIRRLMVFGCFVLALCAPVLAGAALVAAVLPGSRSVLVGDTATAFATIINAGPGTATGCSISPVTFVPADFLYQTTNPATNALSGTPNTPVDIAEGMGQSFVFAFTPTAPFAPTDVQLSFDCTNTTPAATFSGLNTLLLSGSSTPVPDIIVMAATLQSDGVVHIPAGGTGAFSVASVNVGAGGMLTVSGENANSALSLTISVCETNPADGQCLAPPSASVSTQINAGATPTFSFFVSAGSSVALDPAGNRLSVLFRDGSGITRGSTSVAVEGGGGNVTGGSNLLTLQVSSDVDWVALQDGPTGEWRRWMPSATNSQWGYNTYTADISDPMGRYGIARHWLDGALTNNVGVFFAALTEADVVDLTTFFECGTISGVVSTDASAGAAQVSSHGASAEVAGGPNKSFSAQRYCRARDSLPGSTTDIIAMQLAQGGFGSRPPERYLIQRGVGLTNGSIAGLSLDLPVSGVGVSAPIPIYIINSNSSSTVGSTVQLWTELGNTSIINDSIFGSNSSAYLPASGLLPADWVSVLSETLELTSDFMGIEKSLEVFVPAIGFSGVTHNMDQITELMLADLSFAGRAITVNYTPSSSSPPIASYEVLLQQLGDFSSIRTNTWQMMATDQWLSGRLSIPVPEFSGVDGYDSSWLRSGEPASANVDVIMLSGSGESFGFNITGGHQDTTLHSTSITGIAGAFSP